MTRTYPCFPYTALLRSVQAALADFVLLKADVTANDEIDQALMQRFGIIGPPATLFFNGSPEERRGLRLVGFEKAAPFAERVRRAAGRSEEHTSELQSLMRISYAVFCLKKTKHKQSMTT